MADDVSKLLLSSAVIDVFTQNPGLNISISDALLVTFKNAGCIRMLRYGTGSDNLVYVQFDNAVITNVDALKKFKETFECAAKYGMGVTYCESTDGRTISMVNLYPCRCKCKD
ncbi:MAG: hypothetical protein R2762_02295 [Bryobacteraceae bacterium]